MLERLTHSSMRRAGSRALVIDEATTCPRARLPANASAPGESYQLIRLLAVGATTGTSRSTAPCAICTGVVATLWPDRGSWEVTRIPGTDLLSNREFTASIVSSPRLPHADGRLRWKVRLDTGLRPDNQRRGAGWTREQSGPRLLSCRGSIWAKRRW